MQTKTATHTVSSASHRYLRAFIHGLSKTLTGALSRLTKTRKVTSTLLINITILAIVPMLLAITALSVAYTDMKEHEVKVKLQDQLQRKQAQVENTIESTRLILSTLAKSQPLQHYLHRENSPQYAQQATRELVLLFQTYIEQYSQIYMLELMDINGDVKATYFTNDYSKSTANYFIESLNKRRNSAEHLSLGFDRPLQHTKSVFINTHIERQPMVFIAEQLPSKTSSLFLVATINPNVLTQYMTHFNDLQASAMMLSYDGHIVISSEQDLRGRQLDPADLQAIFAALNNDTLLHGLTSFSYLPSQPLMQDVFVVSTDKHGLIYLGSKHDLDTTELFKTLPGLMILATALCCLLIPFAIIYSLNRTIVRPLNEVKNMSIAVEEKRFSYRMEPTKGGDEISQLAKQLNVIMQRLGDSHQDVMAQADHLEETIDNRTKELQRTNKRLNAAKNEALQASELKSRFLANMSHEIRTPLTAIIGFTEQCLEDGIPENEANDMLTTVLASSRHLLELINNILDLSKIEAEKLVIEITEFSIFDVIESVRAIVGQLAADKRLPFDIDVDFPIPEMVRSDQTRLRQILLNLCSNAVKFTHSGHVKVHIRFDKNDGFYQFRVIDTGIGMTDKELNKLFKPFEQADGSTTRKFGGTGLGLFISKSLVELLEGSINVSSKKHQGSEFTFGIKCQYHQRERRFIHEAPKSILPPTIAESKHTSSVFTQGIHILAAEDNPNNQKLLHLLLKRFDATVEVVDNGKQAVQKALEVDFDLIIMDMQMPVMGGLEATQTIRATGCDTPIIALTANVMTADVQKYTDVGCNATIAKPINRTQFYQTVERVLEAEKLASTVTAFKDNPGLDQDLALLTEGFQRSLPDSRKALHQAMQDKDWPQVVRVAHSLKGSAGCFGFNDITEAAASLEHFARADNVSLSDLNEAYHWLDNECQKALH